MKGMKFLIELEHCWGGSLYNLINEINNDEKFKVFTKIFIKSLNGAMLSTEYLDNKELGVINKSKIYLKVVSKECKNCGFDNYFNYSINGLKCDECGSSINNDQSEDNRIKINDNILKQLIKLFNIDLFFLKNKFKIRLHFIKDTAIVIKFEPKISHDKYEFKCLDKLNLNLFELGWNLSNFKLFYKNKEVFLNKILNYIKDSKDKQIRWSKLNPTTFQDLVYDIIKEERIFKRILRGGNGPDQGKDGFGWKHKITKGKINSVKFLIQCKFTKVNRKFSVRDINNYYQSALRHGCRGLIFATNAQLSGDTYTQLGSSAYKGVKIVSIEGKDLFDLLMKHDNLRIKYFT